MSEEAKFESFVAVDVGSFSLKFAYIVRGEDGAPTLITLAQMIIPPFENELSEEQLETMSKDDVKNHCLKELRQFLTTRLTELLYDNEIQTKRCITFSSNREVTIRCIEIPPVVDKNRFDSVIKLEANKQMPFSTGNAVIGYNVQGDIMRDEKALTQVMVAALQKDVIDHINLNIKGGGLINEGVITLPQALELALKKQLAPYSEGDKKVAIIHCGNSTTSIMVYKNGKIQFFRDVNMAGATITEAIYAGGEIDGEHISFKNINEATELKHKVGVLPPDEMAKLKGAEKFAAGMIFETVEKIFQHIQLSISFYISQTGESGLDKIILTGGSAGMINFKEFIEESLEVPTSIADPFTDLNLGEIKYDNEKRQIDAPGLAPIIGTGLYNGEKDIINFIDILFPNRKSQSINLSRVSTKFSGNFSANLFKMDESKLRIVAGLLGTIVLLVGLYPIVSIRKKVTDTKTNYKKLQRDLRQLRSAQNEATSLLAEQSALAKYKNFAKELDKLKTNNSELLLEIASATPRQIFLTSAEISKGATDASLKLRGHADNSDSVFEYLSILGKSKALQTPLLELTDEVEIDETRFFIRFALNCKIDFDVFKPKPEIEEEEFESFGDFDDFGFN